MRPPAGPCAGPPSAALQGCQESEVEYVLVAGLGRPELRNTSRGPGGGSGAGGWASAGQVGEEGREAVQALLLALRTKRAMARPGCGCTHTPKCAGCRCQACTCLLAWRFASPHGHAPHVAGPGRRPAHPVLSAKAPTRCMLHAGIPHHVGDIAVRYGQQANPSRPPPTAPLPAPKPSTPPPDGPSALGLQLPIPSPSPTATPPRTLTKATSPAPHATLHAQRTHRYQTTTSTCVQCTHRQAPARHRPPSPHAQHTHA